MFALPTFANGTTSTGTIQVADNAKQIGGILGDGTPAGLTKDTLKAAMAGGKVAEPSGMVESNEGLQRGLYCGSPYLNSL